MFSGPIEITDAVITSIHHKVEDNMVQTRIIVTGTLFPDIADELDTKGLLFASNGTPKPGFSTLTLDTGCAAFKATFEADPALKQSFEVLSGDSTDKYVVTRQADSVLQLKLRLNYHGDPHTALAYILAVGNGQSVLKITPLQREFDTNHRAEPEPAPKPVSVPKIPKEAVRQRLLPRAEKVGKKVSRDLQ